MRVDKHDLDLLAGDFDRAGRDITKEVAKVTGKACNNIKRDAQARVRGHSHLPHLARSFTYDVTTRADTVTGEVGAKHERTQGKLDVFIEFGTPTSAPIPHWAPAADREVPVWKRYLDDVAAGVLGDR